MIDDTIILDVKKLQTDEFTRSCKDLFGKIHDNTEHENEQLEKDLFRSKIILDLDGHRIECNSIKQFVQSSKTLTAEQCNYILNVGQQGIFGGGSAMIPVGMLAFRHDVMLTDQRNSTQAATDDVPLCVSIKHGKVTLTNSINFTLVSPENLKPKGNMKISMIADITNIKQNKEQETPIHMIISQAKNREVDIIRAVREAEKQAELISPDKKTALINHIQQVRKDKALDSKVKVSQVYREAAQIVAKYAAGTSNPGLNHTKPTRDGVSKIFDNILKNGTIKDILKKNSGMILRQATASKNLSFKDRARKIFDKISLLISPEKRAVKSFVSALRAERKNKKQEMGR